MARILLALLLLLVCFIAIDDRSDQGKSIHTLSSVSASTMRYSGSTSRYSSSQNSLTKNRCGHAGCNNISYSQKYCSIHRCVYGGCENQKKSGGYAYCAAHIQYDSKNYSKKPTVRKRSSATITSSASSSDAADYDDPEDFYEDYADDYDSYEDAEDDWYEAHPDD